MANGNGTVVSVRWVNSILISLVGVLGALVGYLLWSSLIEIKVTQQQQTAAAWQQMGTLNKSEADLAAALGKLGVTVDDNIKSTTQIEDNLNKIVTDHEQRLRGLERPPAH